MWEVLAVCVGVAIGAGTAAMSGAGRRTAVVVLALVAGVGIAVASGEMAESPAFALFDVAQVLVVSVLTAVLVARLGLGRAKR